MYRARVIPCLLISGNSLVKTRKFKDPTYIGDPINAIRIFSEKEADEIFVLDIDASREDREPNFELIQDMASEAFMPMAYGGGIRTLNQIRRLIRCGIEKVVINTAATESTNLLREAAAEFGNQAIVGSIDIRRPLFGSYLVVAKSATVDTRLNLEQHIQNLVNSGVGEIFINNVDRDGMMEGYDIELIRRITQRVNIPVVACGGAGTAEHLLEGIKDGGASAVAAGSIFVYYGKKKAVLINYLKKI